MREDERNSKELERFGPEDEMLQRELEAFEAELSALKPEDQGLDRVGLMACLQMHGSDIGRAPASNSPVLGFIGDCFKQGMSFFSKSSVFSLLVAIGVPILVLSVAVLAITRQGAPSEYVAQIIKTYDSAGYVDEIDAVLSANMKLTEGQQITLQKGFVEIHFEKGSQVIVEAPAVFEVRGDNSSYIKVGRLVASVSPSAHGFTVQTPLATVVDLGTDFGVSVAEDATAEAHVFKGTIKVTVQGTPQDPVSSTAFLTEGQAARIPVADAGETSKIVLMAAVPEQFVRRPLAPPSKPERKSKIIFAHHGSADPTTEGWMLRLIKGPKHKRLDPKTNTFECAPVRDHGVDAWMFANDVKDREVQYAALFNKDQISDEILEKANANGWVLRARIKVEDPGNKDFHGGCFFFYRNGGTLEWSMFISLNEKGQDLTMYGESSLGPEKGRYKIPNSRNRFIDYEIRYNPTTQRADVFVDGRLVAKDYQSVEKDTGRGLRLGLQRNKSKAKVALFEWEVFDSPPDKEQRRGK